MVIKVKDSLCEMIDYKEGGEEDKILVPFDTIYDLEKRGDTAKGPGLSKTKI